MTPDPKSFRSSQTTPLISLFAVVAVALVGIATYDRFFEGGSVEFAPILMWLAITIPAGIFTSIFLQLRAAERAKKVTREVHTRIEELEVEARVTRNPRKSSIPRITKPLPDKDPFEAV
jgi:hypothetical protein